VLFPPPFSRIILENRQDQPDFEAKKRVHFRLKTLPPSMDREPVGEWDG
jgi:hypothetical protein